MRLKRAGLRTDDPYTRYPLVVRPPRRRYRRSRTWLSLVGVIPIVAAVGAVALWMEHVRDDEDVRTPSTRAEVAAARTTSTAQPAAARPPAPPRLALARDDTPLVPVPPRDALARLRGSYVEARGVRVQSVVGPSVFWVGARRRNRLLVHLAGDGDASRPIRRGDRLTFAATLARTPPQAPELWGVTPAEGAFVAGFHGHHLEVEPSAIRFA